MILHGIYLAILLINAVKNSLVDNLFIIIPWRYNTKVLVLCLHAHSKLQSEKS